MRAWNHVLIALAVSFAATGCKITTCDADDEDCASSNGGSLFGGGDDAGGSGGSNDGGTGAGGTDNAGSNAGGNGGTPATEGGAGGTAGTPSTEGGSGGDAPAPVGGAESTDAGSEAAGGGTAVADMCNPDNPMLSECNACIQRTCCTEILACSNDVACSGPYESTDEGMATSMSEIRCVLDENEFLADDANADEDDEVIGYAGDESVELASIRCADEAGGPLSNTTTDLVQCMLHEVADESGEPPEFGDCATACFGVEF